MEGRFGHLEWVPRQVAREGACKLQLNDVAGIAGSGPVPHRDAEVSRGTAVKKQTWQSTDGGRPRHAGDPSVIFTFPRWIRSHQLWPWHLVVPHAAVHDARCSGEEYTRLGGNAIRRTR